MPTAETLLREAQPEAAAALSHLRDVGWATTDADLLERCRLRAAALMGGAPDDDAAPTTPREDAFLAFTEQFVTHVASVTDADVDALLAHAEPSEVYEFIAALYAVEMSLRIELVAATVLAPTAVAA